MRHGRVAVLACGLVLAATTAARADDAAAARALVDKAVKAHGGADALAKVPAVTVKFKGTAHAMGQAFPFTGEVASQGADRSKIDIEIEVMGQKFRFVSVLNGDKGWVKMGDATNEMDKDLLAETKEQARTAWVATLVPLKDKAFTLATTGEVQVDGRTALGVKVSSKGHRDVDLYFDKETGLLVKTEARVKDEGGNEVNGETFYSDYKDVQGVKQAMKLVVKRDGKQYVEGEVSEYQLAESLDASVFAKP
jgi:hypothetical protein